MAAKNRKGTLSDRICRIIATEDAEDLVAEVFKEIADTLDLSGVFFLEAEEQLLLLEIKNKWEREPVIGDSHPIYDLSGKKGRIPVSPYDPKRHFTAIGSIPSDLSQEDPLYFFENLKIRSMMMGVISDKSDYLGAMVCYNTDREREWTEEEQEMVKELESILFLLITRQKQSTEQHRIVEEAEEAARKAGIQRSRFISNVSSEMRTPVNAITGIISILRHNISNPDVLEQCIERLDKSSKQLMELINECVDITLIDDDPDMMREWIMCRDLADEIEKNIGNQLALAPDAPKLVCEIADNSSYFVDKAKIVKVMVMVTDMVRKNLTEGNYLTLQIENTSISSGLTAIKVSISDDRGSMMPEDEKRIRDILSGGDDSNGERGIGLKLIAVRHIAEAMHGAIELYTKQGESTTMSLTIPAEIRLDEAQVKAEEGSSDDFDAELYMGRRILVAEDNVLMAEILATILGYRGLDVDTAMNGREAVYMFKAHEPFYYDMVFMDIQMPVLDGIGATREIRQSDQPDAAIIPIIALSANSFPEEINKALESGMNAHLCKPVSDGELFRTISKYLL